MGTSKARDKNELPDWFERLHPPEVVAISLLPNDKIRSLAKNGAVVVYVDRQGALSMAAGGFPVPRVGTVAALMILPSIIFFLIAGFLVNWWLIVLALIAPVFLSGFSRGQAIEAVRRIAVNDDDEWLDFAISRGIIWFKPVGDFGG